MKQTKAVTQYGVSQVPPNNWDAYLRSGKVREHTFFQTGWKDDDAEDANPKNKSAVVLYHEKCWDGTTAAWCAWLKFKHTAVYIPVNYNRPLPNVDWTRVKQVYILDFSYPREILDELYALLGGNLVVLDHHDTAKKELKDRPYACFADKLSGAGMSWMYFHEKFTLAALAKVKHEVWGSTKASGTMPKLVYFAQDYDLWEFKDKDTRAFRAAQDLYPREIATIQKIHDARVNGTNPMNTDQLVKKGRYLLEQKMKMINEAASTAFLMPFPIPGVPEKDSLLNLCYGVISSNPSITSDLGNVLSKRSLKEGYGGYAVVFSLNKEALKSGKVFLSIRSAKGVDITPLAKAYGGGGHISASGCKWDYAFFLQFLAHLRMLGLEETEPDEKAPRK